MDCDSAHKRIRFGCLHTIKAAIPALVGQFSALNVLHFCMDGQRWTSFGGACKTAGWSNFMPSRTMTLQGPERPEESRDSNIDTAAPEQGTPKAPPVFLPGGDLRAGVRPCLSAFVIFSPFRSSDRFLTAAATSLAESPETRGMSPSSASSQVRIMKTSASRLALWAARFEPILTNPLGWYAAVVGAWSSRTADAFVTS